MDIHKTKMAGILNISILIASIMLGFLALLQTCHGQDTQQDYLTAHNTARAAVNVGQLVWDDNVAAYALDYANQRKGDCSMVHSGGGPNGYGENLAGSSGDLSGTEAVNMWVGEKANYNYDSNTCSGGQYSCLHYTQVVWRNSVRLGCAKVQCDNGGTFITCNYDPPGNFNNQRPY